MTKPPADAALGAHSRRVLVTLAADAPTRELLDGILGDVAALTYLEDLDAGDRHAALTRADALLAWLVDEELGEADWASLEERTRSDRPALLLQLFTAGVDHVPFARVPAGVVVAGNAGGWAEPMAEHVLAMVLALAKRLFVEQEELRRGAFNDTTPCRELRGGACAVVGLGGIGREVAVLMRALGMRVLALNTSGATGEPVDFVGTLADLEPVLRDADVVVITLPLTAATRGLIGARELGWMREDAILVNVARGPIVDEEALYRHLVAHPQFSAGLDVWWDEPFADGRFRVGHPFLELPNVVGSPHNSGVVPRGLELGLGRAAENVRRYLLGEPLTGVMRPSDYLD